MYLFHNNSNWFLKLSKIVTNFMKTAHIPARILNTWYKKNKKGRGELIFRISHRSFWNSRKNDPKFPKHIKNNKILKLVANLSYLWHFRVKYLLDLCHLQIFSCTQKGHHYLPGKRLVCLLESHCISSLHRQDYRAHNDVWRIQCLAQLVYSPLIAQYWHQLHNKDCLN